MKNIPKNKEFVINVTNCRNPKECKDKLLANVALRDIPKYRKRIKFDGGRI